MKSNIQGLYRKMSSRQTIKGALPLFLLLSSFKPGEGTGGSKMVVIRREVKVESTFQSIRIDGNIGVILTNDPAGTVSLEGKEKDLDRIRYTVKNNTLIVDAQRKNSFDDVTVYISAIRLQSIKGNGDMDISSGDMLEVDDLRIFLNGNINVNVKTKGKLSIDAPDEYDLSWETPVMGIRK